MVMDYLPDPAAEWGHDPHVMTGCHGQPDHLSQLSACHERGADATALIGFRSNDRCAGQ
jgi:hypothetical protein